MNPIGELTQELLYLRANDLKVPGLFLLFTLLIEVVELFAPFLATRGVVRGASDALLYLNAGQALLLLASGFLIYLVLQRYTQRGLDRRIRDSMETLAYLAGQRRRRVTRGQGLTGRAPEETPPPRREK